MTQVSNSKISETTDRHYWIDQLRVFSTIGVIFLHVIAGEFNAEGESLNGSWWVLNLIGSFLRCCVPVFVMISGTLLLTERYTLSDFLRKRAARILPPFVFWSCCYIAANLVVQYLTEGKLAFPGALYYIGEKLVYGSSFHLWYVYMILGLYLAIPILSVWIRNATKNEVAYFITIWFLTTIFALSFARPFIPVINLVFFGGFAGYLVLGYFLSQVQPTTNQRTVTLIVLALVVTGTAATALGTYALAHASETSRSEFYGYLTPNVVFISAGIFLWFRFNPSLNRKPGPFFMLVNKHSFGIYLSHMLVLSALYRTPIKTWIPWPLLNVPLVTILGVVISLITVYLISKLPFGKYISG
ncbi:MAG: acyltransferase family protein [Bacteroidota bacterium]